MKRMAFAAIAAVAVAVLGGGGARASDPGTVTIVRVDATASGGSVNEKFVDAGGDAVFAASSQAGGGDAVVARVGPQFLLDVVAASEAEFEVQLSGPSTIAGAAASADVDFTCTGTLVVESFTSFASGVVSLKLDGAPLGGTTTVGAGTHTIRVTGTASAESFSVFVEFTLTPGDGVDPEPLPRAGDLHWESDLDGTWREEPKWTPAGIPGPQSNVFFDPALSVPETYVVTSACERIVRRVFVRLSAVRLKDFDLIAGDLSAPRTLEVGQAGTLEFQGGDLSTRSALVGAAPKSKLHPSSMEVIEARWNVIGTLTVGETNEGRLTMNDGDLLLEPGGAVQVGGKTGAKGRLEFVGGHGELAKLTVGLAPKSSAVLVAEGPATLTSESVVVAAGPKSTGVVELKRAGVESPEWEITGPLDVGGAAGAGGFGTFTAREGSKVTAGAVGIGRAKRKGPPSALHVEGPAAPGGAATTLTAASLDVGIGGPAEMVLSSGAGASIAGDVRVGSFGFIEVGGVTGGEAAGTPSLLTATGSFSAAGNATVFVKPPAALRVAGAADIGGATPGLTQVLFTDDDVLASAAFSSGALTVGGTGKKSRGQFLMQDAVVEAASVLVRGTGEMIGNGMLTLPAAATVRIEGGMGASVEGGGLRITGRVDLAATGRMTAFVSGADDNDAPAFVLDAEAVTLAGTIELSCSDFRPLAGERFRVIEGVQPLGLTGAAPRAIVTDSRGKVIGRAHTEVSVDHVDVVID